MDMKHKDMQYLGAFEIFKETFKIINKNRKIFTMAALCFIHPLNYLIKGLLGTLDKLLSNLHEYENISLSRLFSHNWSFFWPSNLFLIIFLFGYSIFSTAGITHTVAAIYTGREPALKDTMSFVAKVWKRVLVTFLCALLVFLAYHVMAGFAALLLIVDGTSLVVFLVVYFVGLLYLVVVLQLAGVVSSLEELCGFKAMEKSMLLLKGKMATATIVVLAISSGFGANVWLDDVVKKMSLWSISMLMLVLADLSMLLLILFFLLWRLVLETMLYFVCKSYHQEGIDMLTLSDQDDHMPLRSSEC